ncbi:outer membrane scaffolding protein for murein synthesis (MipA/OmpV family) [Sphingomonas zeicaulis]|uniref:MipA/OmpV family protein n=1 Tax=Sphingomonas zeicaulis TaxID=1632740 RepID=UPI003D20A301
MRLFFPALLAAASVLPATSHAQQAPSDDAVHGMVALGAGVVPDYDGASDVRAVPFALADVRWQGLNFEIRGLRARVDLAPDARLAIGPVIGPRMSRKNVDGPVGLLPEIDMAVEAGGYVGYRIGGDELGQGSVQMELSLLHDISGTHDGLVATASASYAAIRQPDMMLSLDVQTSWANSDYARTYFGITSADAAASGLAAFRPGSGFRDVGAGLTAGYWFDRHFGVIGRAGATYLVGDLADSPITDEGSRWQPTAGLSLSYRF